MHVRTSYVSDYQWPVLAFLTILQRHMVKMRSTVQLGYVRMYICSLNEA